MFALCLYDVCLQQTSAHCKHSRPRSTKTLTSFVRSLVSSSLQTTTVEEKDMCNASNNATGPAGAGALLPYGLKFAVPTPFTHLAVAGLSPAAFDLHRAQLLDYNARVRCALTPGYAAAAAAAAAASIHGVPGFHFAPHCDPVAYLYKNDQRARFMHEEPKPSHSYIGLIAMAILSSEDKKLVLSEIYQWILDNYAYFRSRGPGWRNSIRHNLSLNDCFVKSGRSANGKGHYWAIHPANLDDFEKGDFRRRRAQRRVRKAMGLSVPEEDDSPSPTPPTAADWQERMLAGKEDRAGEDDPVCPRADSFLPLPLAAAPMSSVSVCQPVASRRHHGKKRLFDVASLLAPDTDSDSDEDTCRLDADSCRLDAGPPSKYLRPTDCDVVDLSSGPNDEALDSGDTRQPSDDTPDSALCVNHLASGDIATMSGPGRRDKTWPPASPSPVVGSFQVPTTWGDFPARERAGTGMEEETALGLKWKDAFSRIVLARPFLDSQHVKTQT